MSELKEISLTHTSLHVIYLTFKKRQGPAGGNISHNFALGALGFPLCYFSAC